MSHARQENSSGGPAPIGAGGASRTVTAGNRIRFSTEPFLWLLALWAVPALRGRKADQDLGGQAV